MRTPFCAFSVPSGINKAHIFYPNTDTDTDHSVGWIVTYTLCLFFIFLFFPAGCVCWEDILKQNIPKSHVSKMYNLTNLKKILFAKLHNIRLVLKPINSISGRSDAFKLKMSF